MGRGPVRLVLSLAAALSCAAALPAAAQQSPPPAAGTSVPTAHDGAVSRIALLVRVGRAEEALAAISAPPPAGLGGDLLDPSVRLLRAEALYRLGRRPEAVAEIAAGAARWSGDPRFPRLFLERAATVPSGEAERRLVALFLGRLPALAEQDPGLSLLAVPFMMDGAGRVDAVRAYRALGLASPRSTLLALEYGLVDSTAATAEFFALPGPLALRDLVRLRDLEGDGKGREALRAALASFSGTLVEDRDGDGCPESTSAYDRGSLIAWARDADQDGNPEYRLEFADGRPARAAVDSGGLSASIEWGSWPYVGRAAFGDETYSLGPEAWSWSPVALEGFPSPSDPVLFVAKAVDCALPAPRTAAASALELVVQGSDREDRILLDGGLPLRRERREGGRLVAVLDYSAGFPLREDLDADGDGRFETRRLWPVGRAGQAAGAGQAGEASQASRAEASAGRTEAPPLTVLVDGDGDGIYEYREDLAFPFVKEWDFDGDGRMDARQSATATGGVLREFSSHLDGRFDEALSLDPEGRFLDLSRDGARVPLLRDRNARVFWIGAKPFDLGEEAVLSEGVHVRGGLRYRLFAAGGYFFAELVE